MHTTCSPLTQLQNFWLLIFIDGIDESNKYIRNKLREKTGTNLEWYFTESQHLQHKQEIRAIDFKPDTETQTINFTHATTDINAIRNNSLTWPQM